LTRQGVSRARAFVPGISGTMNGSVNDRGLPADVFHNVDLAAGGPVGGVDVISQHPKRRPKTLTKGNPEARFEPSVLSCEFAFGSQTRRSVIACHVVNAGIPFLNGFNDQGSLRLIGVVNAVRVVLQFLISPSVPANLRGPPGRIDRRVVSRVEFVTPNQTPD